MPSYPWMSREQRVKREEKGQSGRLGCSPVLMCGLCVCRQMCPPSTAVLHCKIWILLFNPGEDAKDKQKSLQSDVQTMVMYFIIK